MGEKLWSPFAEVYDPLMCGSIDRTDEEPHDHGIVRAMNATFKPDPSLVNDPSKTICVSYIDYNTKEEQVKTKFAEYGPIKYLRLVTDLVTGFSKGYAFIEYEDKYDAITAWNRGHKALIDGKEVVVEYELERVLPGWKPRRLGGGFGGRKGSGQLRFGGRERPFRKPILMDEYDSAYKRNGIGNLDRGEVDSGERPHRTDGRYSQTKNRQREDRYKHRDRDRRSRERSYRDRDRDRDGGRDRGRDRPRDRDRSRERESRRHRERKGRF